jgi:hypothetical protein
LARVRATFRVDLSLALKSARQTGLEALYGEQAAAGVPITAQEISNAVITARWCAGIFRSANPNKEPASDRELLSGRSVAFVAVAFVFIQSNELVMRAR